MSDFYFLFYNLKIVVAFVKMWCQPSPCVNVMSVINKVLKADAWFLILENALLSNGQKC